MNFVAQAKGAVLYEGANFVRCRKCFRQDLWSRSKFMIRILIVDDDALIRDFFMTHGPREMDAIFFVVSSGNDAIRLLTEGQSFDVIITDYQMNNGSGADLLSYLSENNAAVISALYTSSPDPKLRAVNEGFIGKFDKLELTAMLTRIRAALAELPLDSVRSVQRR